MTKKILFCASTISHINHFHLPYLKAFYESGYEVWVAANTVEPVPYAHHVIAVPFYKKSTSIRNLKAIFIFKELLHDQQFDIVSTHTALASAVVRVAISLLPRRPIVFCTVHGYLFSNNEVFKKWPLLIIEKLCSHVTDILMVMNQEDYNIAQKYRLYRDNLYYINGMGIDLNRFVPAAREMKFEMRRNQGFNTDDFIFLYAAEFSKRKNQSLLIRAFANVSKEYPNVKLLLAGDGALLEDCKSLVRELCADNQTLFLGYLTEMKDLYSITDAIVSPSRSEGLPFNVMEAMASGLPVIASKIKGHLDLVDHQATGLLFEPDNQADLEQALIEIFRNSEKRSKYGQNGLKKIQHFGLNRVFPQIMDIYKDNSQTKL